MFEVNQFHFFITLKGRPGGLLGFLKGFLQICKGPYKIKSKFGFDFGLYLEESWGVLGGVL